MNEFVKHSLIWGTVLASVLCSLIWAIAWHSVATKREAMKAGLIQKPRVVYSEHEIGTYWTKPGLEQSK
jgi:hypothetical protein